jgi:predicted alpha-1,6-mannanase (GH76 family)
MVIPRISHLGLVMGVVTLQFFHNPAAKHVSQDDQTATSGISRSSLDAGMAALQPFYDSTTGLWNSAKWWNSANALETTIDYSAITQTDTYRSIISNTFDKQKHTNFFSPWFYDDEGWWALTWIKAYDLTGETRYLDMAKTLFDDMKGGWDSTCGGGIWWTKNRGYKNAIVNELFLAVAARLHLRTPEDSGAGSYIDWAQREWDWFKQSGMISGNLINDGLDGNCQNNKQTAWTYNQGVVLGGLVDLYHSTKDPALLTQAQAIADAAIHALAPEGILREPCEPAECGVDGLQFKGIFIRNLSYLYQSTPQPSYQAFILKNAGSVWSHRSPQNQFGLSWAEPFDMADAVRQSSAMDAINAALTLNVKAESPGNQSAAAP